MESPLIRLSSRLAAATLLTGDVDAPSRLVEPATKSVAGNSAVEWVCLGSGFGPLAGPWETRVAAMLERLDRITPRVQRQRWVRYRISLAEPDADSGISAPRLTPMTPDVIEKISLHPDAQHPDVASALKFPEIGLTGGHVWLEGGEPLCMQWLFTSRDNDALRRLPVWAGMYPRLPEGVGQVEKLWTFSTARQRGVATKFAQGMFAESRARGLRELRTHILESNVPATLWAERTGWNAYGTITRYSFDVPGLRRDGLTIFVHATEDADAGRKDPEAGTHDGRDAQFFSSNPSPGAA